MHAAKLSWSVNAAEITQLHDISVKKQGVWDNPEVYDFFKAPFVTVYSLVLNGIFS